jgi:hypothetical protein
MVWLVYETLAYLPCIAPISLLCTLPHLYSDTQDAGIAPDRRTENCHITFYMGRELCRISYRNFAEFIFPEGGRITFVRCGESR